MALLRTPPQHLKYISSCPIDNELSDGMARAIQIRLDALVAEQESDAAEHESLYARSDELLYRITARQEWIRHFRDLLLNCGRVA